MRASAVVLGVLVLSCGAPGAAAADEPSLLAGAASQPVLGLLFADAVRPRPPRAFRHLFATAVTAALPIPVSQDECDGVYFARCDPFTQCAINVEVCEVSERFGVPTATNIGGCSACQSPGLR